jgi:hypothetical protein
LSSFSRILTIAVIALAIVAISSLIYSQSLITNNSYNSEIQVSFTKSPVAYDYSCGTNDYQIHFVIRNTGSKNVVGFSVSITSPLCAGSLPSIPDSLNASSTVAFYAQSSSENGTLTISGNNTLVQVNF